MLSAVSDIFIDLISYVNILFQNELIVYLVALMIVAGLIGMFSKLIKFRT